jgi:hypothetical protein
MPDPSGGRLGRDVHRGSDALTLGIAAFLLQDQGGGLQPVSYWARKLNPTERGNTYSVYDLEILK